MTSSPASNRLQVAPPPPEIVYSCEICGQDDLNEAEMRTHMEAVHLKGALQCPFCDLSSHDVTANEMTLHVNSARLEYLTPQKGLSNGYFTVTSLTVHSVCNANKKTDLF